MLNQAEYDYVHDFHFVLNPSEILFDFIVKGKLLRCNKNEQNSDQFNKNMNIFFIYELDSNLQIISGILSASK